MQEDPFTSCNNNIFLSFLLFFPCVSDNERVEELLKAIKQKSVTLDRIRHNPHPLCRSPAALCSGQFTLARVCVRACICPCSESCCVCTQNGVLSAWVSSWQLQMFITLCFLSSLPQHVMSVLLCGWPSGDAQHLCYTVWDVQNTPHDSFKIPSVQSGREPVWWFAMFMNTLTCKH